MTENILSESYKFCLEQGWVHNTPIENVLSDYFNKTDGRKTLFDNHFSEILENSNCHEINILIGEAPPYYPNSKYPEKEKRTYFYDSGQSLDTPYFKEPCKYFLKIADWKIEKRDYPDRTKAFYLQNLAEKGVLIFDIFPFPIFQSTGIREQIVYKNSKQSFITYLDKYFEPRLKNLLDGLSKKELTINMYLFAPKLASVHFLFWLKDKDHYKYLVKFMDTNFTFSETSKKADGKDMKFINDSFRGFLDRITLKDENLNKEFQEKLKSHPILMNNSGNPDFKNFVNGKIASYNSM
jgi:hypothetical protein